MIWLLKMFYYRLVRGMRPQLERAANLRLLQELVREAGRNNTVLGITLALAAAKEQIDVIQRQCIEARWADRQGRLQAIVEIVERLAREMERVSRSAKHAAPMFLVPYVDIKDAMFKTLGTVKNELDLAVPSQGHWSQFLEASLKAIVDAQSELRCLVAVLQYVVSTNELLDARAYQPNMRSQGFAAALEAISAEKGLEIQFEDMDAPSVPHLGICGIWLLSGMCGAVHLACAIGHHLGTCAAPSFWLLLASLPCYAIWGMWSIMWQRRLRLAIMRHFDAYRRVREAAQT